MERVAALPEVTKTRAMIQIVKHLEILFSFILLLPVKLSNSVL